MDRFEETTYGERIAEIYDTWYGGVSDDCLGILTELADGGRALELGIGTGRVALPLKERGIEVHGIDSSPAMLAKPSPDFSPAFVAR